VIHLKLFKPDQSLKPTHLLYERFPLPLSFLPSSNGLCFFVVVDCAASKTVIFDFFKANIWAFVHNLWELLGRWLWVC
jgi:hypothetical protein